MQKVIDSLTLALRVLEAVLQNKKVPEADVRELMRLAPDYPHESLDELACEVIKRASQRRKQILDDPAEKK